MVTLILGRDGMGDATAADFEDWMAYVNDRIDDRVGFTVWVAERLPRDVQNDEITGATDAQREIVNRAKQDLWDDWCAEGAPHG